jgi:phospholipid-binding lipoprotein MlaA
VHRIGVSASRFLEVASAVVVLMVVGCAGGPSPTTLNTGVGGKSDARAEFRAVGGETVQVAAAPAVSPNVILAANKSAPSAATEPTVEPAEDPFYDPVCQKRRACGGRRV